jgi:hypothetical protein
MVALFVEAAAQGKGADFEAHGSRIDQRDVTAGRRSKDSKWLVPFFEGTHPNQSCMSRTSNASVFPMKESTLVNFGVETIASPVLPLF